MPFEYLSINDIQIRIAKSIINEKKPTILLLSPFPHSIMAFAPIWEILKDDFNLYAYDLPGFGRSDTSPSYMSFKFQGEFLNDFIAHFNIENAHLVGPRPYSHTHRRQNYLNPVERRPREYCLPHEV